MIRKLLAGIFVVALLPVWIGCGGLPKSAVAQIDDSVITREDLDRTIEYYKARNSGQGVPEPGSEQYTEMQKQITEALVISAILESEAKDMGITVSDEEVNAQLTQAMGQMGEEQFKSSLESQGISLDFEKDNIRKQILEEKVTSEIMKDINVSDEELLDYYNQHKTDPILQRQSETKAVKGLVVADEAAANAAKARLDAGEDISKVSSEVSLNPELKSAGGDLGEIPTKDSGAPPEIETVMNSLAPGQTSNPIKSSDGYYIIRVDATYPPGQYTFEQIKDRLRSYLISNKQREAAVAWLDSAKQRHEIIYADEFKPTETTATTETTAQPGS